MILAVAATEIEMAPFRAASTAGPALACRTLVTGVGPVETTLQLTRFLCRSGEQVTAVVHFGVGGAYILANESGQRQPGLLDICLAEQEVAGDFGICLGETMAYLKSSFTGEIVYKMDALLLKRSKIILDTLAIPFHSGVFVTVNGITGTAARGEMLQSRWNGLCENMEGAAVARVCREFELPCVELRCIANYVENRDPSTWRLPEACWKAAHTATLLLRGLNT